MKQCWAHGESQAGKSPSGLSARLKGASLLVTSRGVSAPCCPPVELLGILCKGISSSGFFFWRSLSLCSENQRGNFTSRINLTERTKVRPVRDYLRHALPHARSRRSIAQPCWQR